MHMRSEGYSSGVCKQQRGMGPSVAEKRRRRAKYGGPSLIDYEGSSGTEESIQVSSKSSDGNNGPEHHSRWSTKIHNTQNLEVEITLRNFLGESESDNSSDEEGYEQEYTSEEPLLDRPQESESTCSCLPRKKMRPPYGKKRRSKILSQIDDSNTDTETILYEPFRPQKVSRAQTPSSQAPTAFTFSFVSDNSSELHNEPTIDVNNLTILRRFDLGQVGEPPEGEEPLIIDSEDKPLLQHEVSRGSFWTRSPRGKSKRGSRKVTSPKKGSKRFSRFGYKCIAGDFTPLSLLALEFNRVENLSPRNVSRTERDKKSSYISSPPQPNMNENLHKELDELVLSMESPSRAEASLRDPYRLSTLYEEEEDEDIVSQATISKHRRKTQKLAEYLKRDGEAYYDYEDEAHSENMSQAEEDEEELAGLLFAGSSYHSRSYHLSHHASSGSMHSHGLARTPLTIPSQESSLRQMSLVNIKEPESLLRVRSIPSLKEPDDVDESLLQSAEEDEIKLETVPVQKDTPSSAQPTPWNYRTSTGPHRIHHDNDDEYAEAPEDELQLWSVPVLRDFNSPGHEKNHPKKNALSLALDKEQLRRSVSPVISSAEQTEDESAPEILVKANSGEISELTDEIHPVVVQVYKYQGGTPFQYANRLGHVVRSTQESAALKRSVSPTGSFSMESSYEPSLQFLGYHDLAGSSRSRSHSNHKNRSTSNHSSSRSSSLYDGIVLSTRSNRVSDRWPPQQGKTEEQVRDDSPTARENKRVMTRLEV